MEKTVLRVQLRKLLSDLTSAQMQESDQALFHALLSLPELEQANTISVFWGITGLEPDTSQLIPQLLERGKTVCLPRIISDYGLELRRYTADCPMARSTFGIMEPTIECPLVSRESIDLVIVPALCYDRRGYRLGYGGGYYDRWLTDYTGVTVGMCRDLVIQDQLPSEDHDQPVHIVVTENQVLRF